MATRREVRLSPSNLNYEDRRCDRCFAEAANGEAWPQRPFPGIFAKLDSQQRRYFTDRPTSDVDPGLPPGTLHNGGRVQSAPHTIGGVDFTIRGSMDALLRFDDGSVGVVDFKSSTASPALGDAYRPQLAAYQWSLSHPASGDAETVSVAGLLIFVINRAYFGWTIQPSIAWGAIAQQCVTILGAATLASLYPALRASRTPATELSRENL